MKSGKALLLLILILMAGCGGGGGGAPASGPPPTLATLSVTPANSSLGIGNQKQFTATGTFSDNSTQDLTASATWSSSATSIATISNTAGTKGLATGVAVGATTITAASGAVSGSTTLTVTPPPALVTITVTPASPAIAAGSQQQFTATGTFSDNSTQNLTTSATWNSSVTAIATVSDAAGTKGLATAVAAGATTIAVTSGAVTGSTNLIVTGGTAGNVLPVTVNGALCSAGTSASYPNKPCVSVTICAPGTSTCQTIDDILLDTGSFGLRIFRQAIPTTVLPSATGTLAECIQFGDGTSVWGPVQTADVILGNEPAVSVPIQVIDSTFGTSPTIDRPAFCSNAHPDPAAARYTGILGVGLFTHDCPTNVCTNNPANHIYFSCNGTTPCSGTVVPPAGQVQNPVSLLPVDNNGVIVQLPSIPAGGTSTVSGNLVLGIGTKPNNAPTSVASYSADPITAQFSTQFSGQTYSSFLDTGSNGYFFTPPASVPIPTCGPWFCPAATTNLSATNTAASGSPRPSGTVPFRIGNFTSLTSPSTGNNVFAEIGGTFPQDFDWGLPFFFGKNVHVGFEGKTAGALGTGPFWAY